MSQTIKLFYICNEFKVHRNPTKRKDKKHQQARIKWQTIKVPKMSIKIITEKLEKNSLAEYHLATI